jgi:nucleotide-binding universal stress UspA family protein
MSDRSQPSDRVRRGDQVEAATIIWATDGSDLADHALDVVRDVAKKWVTSPRVVAVHIDQRWTGRGMNVPKLAGEEDLEKKIEAQVQALDSEGFATGFELRRSNRMEDESALLASVANEIDADMIVVGTRGHGRFAGALLGSVAQGLLHRAPCPVLVVPPLDGEDATTEMAEQSGETTVMG